MLDASQDTLLGGTDVRQIIELRAQGKSIREIARITGQSRNNVCKYLRAPGLPVAHARPKRGSILTPFQSYLDIRLREGGDNAVVLLRELRPQGYSCGYTTVKTHLHPHRVTLQQTDRRTVRFETDPGFQAQVDFGQYSYLDP